MSQAAIRVAELERVLENILEHFENGTTEDSEGNIFTVADPLKEALDQADETLNNGDRDTYVEDEHEDTDAEN